MSEKAPKISVVIPIYNAEEYLEECLESVVGQTLRDIEIICINDGSTDNSAKICEKYAKKDKRIIFVSTENKGPGAARNTGLGFAKGEFIGFVDSDDWIDLDFYEKLYTAAVETDADIATGGIVRKDDRRHKVRLDFKERVVYTVFV